MVSVEELKPLEFLKGIPDSELKILSTLSEVVFIRPSKTLYSEGEPAEHLFFISQGEIHLTLDYQDRKPDIIAKLGPGCCFGQGEIFLGKTYLNAISQGDSKLFRIGQRALKRCFKDLPWFQNRLMEDLASVVRLGILNRKFLKGTNQVYLVLRYHLKKENLTGDRVVLSPEVTMESLAHSLNLTREHVSRVFSELKDRRVVDKEGHRLVIYPQRLETLIDYNEIYDDVKF